MTIETYEEMIKNIPSHTSEKFIDFLRERNVVRYESENWLVIENIKYHRENSQWLTAFYKSNGKPSYNVIGFLFDFYLPQGWLLKENESNQQSIARYHLHLIEKPEALLELEKMVKAWKESLKG